MAESEGTRQAKQPSPWTVESWTERIPVYSNLPEPDQNWRYTDAGGHEHRWDNGYPTLKVVATGADCEDEHTDSHLECPLCGEKVVPGTVGPSPFPKYIAGSTDYSLIYSDGLERREYGFDKSAIERYRSDPAGFIESLDADNPSQPASGVLLLSEEYRMPRGIAAMTFTYCRRLSLVAEPVGQAIALSDVDRWRDLATAVNTALRMIKQRRAA